MVTPSLEASEVAEELLVGAPPERIIDHVGAGQRRGLEVEPVERNLVAQAVDR